MAWTIPSSDIINGQTFVKDTDNKIQNQISDLEDYVNGTGDYVGSGLTQDFPVKDENQTITGVYTFTNGINSNVTGNLTGSVTGNSSTATKLLTARTITLSGDSIGSVSFDGTSNVTINTTISHIVPSGCILMWSGSIETIPEGWYLCDGENGTPNLVDRFIVPAGNTYDVGDTGGYKDAMLVSHSHTANLTGTTSTKSLVGTHAGDDRLALGLSGIVSGYMTYDYSGSDGGGRGAKITIDATHNHTVSVSGTTSTVGTTDYTNKNLPPYYALAYIMKA